MSGALKPPHPIGAQPASRIDYLLDILPQQQVADFGYAQRVGQTTLMVACRPPADLEQVKALGHEEYKALLLLSDGMTYKEIATQLSKSSATIRSQLNNAYGKLAVRDGIEAASFIPQDYRPVFELSPHEMFPQQRQVFGMIGDGLTTRQIAQVLVVEETTVRGHKTAIVDALGIGGEGTGKAGIKLRRLAGALKMVGVYQEMSQIVDKSGFQPRISALLQEAHAAERAGRLRELDGKVVHTINNPPLLQILEQDGYVPKGTSEHGEVDLSGFIATRLLGNVELASVMAHQPTKPIVKASINSMVREYLSKRAGANGAGASRAA